MKITELPSTLTTEFEMVSTRVASRLLLRQPRTLQAWGRHRTGPVTPININGRLAWPVAAIRRILSGA